MQQLSNKTKIASVIDRISQHSATLWLREKGLWVYKKLPLAITYGYAFLYMYTGYDKLRHVEVFIKGNSKIPLIGQHAELIGWGIPLLEILLAALLVFTFGKARQIALRVSVIMMGIFTLYLLLMLLFVPDRLCQCGGVIESMGWITHLIFNLIWLGAGVYAIKKNKNYKRLNLRS